jgi:pimeloyl-ACP methyl ester carboxylesterase
MDGMRDEVAAALLPFDGWRQRFAEANGLRFSYLDWGSEDAPALVLLHGITVEAHCWDLVANALQDERRIIALDLRGHGDSAWPRPPAYDTRDFVADLAALAPQWRVERFALGGHSSGALASFSFAREYPEAVERLVAIDPAPLGGHNGAPAWAALPRYDSFEAMLEATLKLFPRSQPEWAHHWAATNARQLPDGSWTRKHCPDLQEHLRLGAVWDVAKDVACPTLIVRGALSNPLSQPDAERLAASMPDARLLTLEGAGHPVAQDRPEELSEAIRAFLRAEE